jgi:hypothetical protein
MENFSSINNNLTTSRDQLIKHWSQQTGLPKENVISLYENFNVSALGDLSKINESFTKFLSNTNNFDLNSFKNKIFELSGKIVNVNSIEERNKILSKFYSYIESSLAICTDSSLLIEIICFVLLSRNNNFKPIADKLKFGFNLNNLFESENVNFEKINVLKYNAEQKDVIQIKDDIKFYDSLKLILSRNNKRWGYNYHLDNVYETIVSYLDNEIKQLVNKDNIYTVNDTFEMELLNQIVTTEQLNPMYKHVDVLRNLIPDLQTLIFDCMLIVNNYVVCNQETINFLARTNYIDYINACKTLFSAISSSVETSKILFVEKNPSPDTINGTFTNSNTDSDFSQIFNNFKIDTKKLDVYAYPVQLTSAIECIHIIKSCETDFNLKLRKVLNYYVTKSMNLLNKTGKVTYERRKINKFKNGY